MDKFFNRVEAIIAQHGLLAAGDAAVLAVSGGVDSMVLLHVMHALSQKHGWSLAVAHLNHQLRGRAADADEQFVARAAKKLGLPFHSARCDVRRYAHEHKLSMEMAARALRHEFLARTARELKINKVALAHHADDQVELFFLRLLRGAGPQGLGGMDWSAPSPANSSVVLLRPLLGETKSMIEKAAHAHGIQFRADATNRSTDILRNRVRARLVPLLKRSFQPAIHQVVLRTMDVLRADAEFIEHEALAWLRGRRRKDWAALPLALQRAVLQSELLRLGVTPEFELIERLRLNAAIWITVAPNMNCRRTQDGHVETRAPGVDTFVERETIAVAITPSGRARVESVEIQWRIVRGGKLPKRRAAHVEWFDAARVGDSVIVRHWSPGDRFQPIGMPQPAKLQDLFVNEKIPRAQRHELLLATSGSGEIFWVESLRIGELFKVTSKTKNVLRWQWNRHIGLALR